MNAMTVTVKNQLHSRKSKSTKIFINTTKQTQQVYCNIA